jgi:hypothetical protein
MWGAVLGGLGALTSIMGSQSDSQGLENQAISQEYSAIEAELSGRSQAASIRRQASAIIGSQVTAAAGSGVQVDTGSVLDVIEESAYNIELDALTVESDSKRQAEALRAGAASSRSAKPSGVSTLLGAFGAGASGYATGLSING